MFFDLERVTVAGRQQRLGTDPARIYEFVRDAIACEPYAGVLRGAQGTLIACAGNALDQALLLSALLSEAGHSTRFAQGTLDPAQCKAVLASASAHPASGVPLNAATQPILDHLLGDVQRLSELIMKALHEAGVTVPPSPPRSPEVLADLVRSHFWVQLRNGDNWVDLDPVFPTAGVANASIERTFDEPPNDLFHRIVIRIVVEEPGDGKAQERVLLTQEYRTCDVAATPILVTHQRSGWTKPIDLQGAGLAATVSEAFVATFDGRVRPVLVMPTTYVVGEVFKFEDADEAQPGFGMLGSILADASGGPKATAERVELECHAPDGHVERTTRELFDRIGIGARIRGGSDAAKSAPHPLDSMLCLSVFTGPIADEVAFCEQQQPEGANAPRFLMDFNAAVHTLSHRLTNALDFGNGPVPYVIGAPRLLFSSIGLDGTTDVIAIDLRSSPATRVGRAETGGPSAFAVEVVRGVVEGVVEQFVIDSFLTEATQPGAATRQLAPGACRVFRETAPTETRPRVLRGAAELPSDLGEDAAARLRAELSGGALVVIPERPVMIDGVPRTAWWRIDPETGTTVAVAENGLHYASREYAVCLDRGNGTYYIMWRSPGTGMEVVQHATTSFRTAQALAQAFARMGYVRVSYWLI